MNIVDIFEKQVDKTPDNISIIFKEKKMSYDNLNKLSNQLANIIKDKMKDNQVDKEVIIPVYLNKSDKFIISILAILKLGFAYVAIDPEYPIDRVNYILDHVDANIVIIDNKIDIKNLKGVNILNIDTCNYKNVSDQNLKVNINDKSLAYVMYTSGSTGKPKGILIEHKAKINEINYVIKNRKLNSNDIHLHLINTCFDASTRQIFWPLGCGGTVYLLENKNYIIDSSFKICSVFFTPSIFDIFMDLNPQFKCEIIYFGGEKISSSHLEKARKVSSKIYNCYGPAECAGIIAQQLLTDDYIYLEDIVDNCYYKILDDKLVDVEKGEIGELYIGGEQLSRGYLKNLELTNSVFIKIQNEILYKSGDLAKKLTDNKLIICGRSDSQIKINGIRIELDEITDELQHLAGIERATTIFHNNMIILFYTILKSVNKENKQFLINHRNLYEYLKKKLPEYMLPVRYIILDEFKLNSNGKIDKHVLNNKINSEISIETDNTDINIIYKNNDEINLIIDILLTIKPDLNKTILLNNCNDDLKFLGISSNHLIILYGKIIQNNYSINQESYIKCKSIKEISEIMKENVDNEEYSIQNIYNLFSLNYKNIDLISKEDNDTIVNVFEDKSWSIKEIDKYKPQISWLVYNKNYVRKLYSPINYNIHITKNKSIYNDSDILKKYRSKSEYIISTNAMSENIISAKAIPELFFYFNDNLNIQLFIETVNNFYTSFKKEKLGCINDTLSMSISSFSSIIYRGACNMDKYKEYLSEFLLDNTQFIRDTPTRYFLQCNLYHALQDITTKKIDYLIKDTNNYINETTFNLDDTEDILLLSLESLYNEQYEIYLHIPTNIYISYSRGHDKALHCIINSKKEIFKLVPNDQRIDILKKTIYKLIEKYIKKTIVLITGSIYNRGYHINVNEYSEVIQNIFTEKKVKNIHLVDVNNYIKSYNELYSFHLGHFTSLSVMKICFEICDKIKNELCIISDSLNLSSLYGSENFKLSYINEKNSFTTLCVNIMDKLNEKTSAMGISFTFSFANFLKNIQDYNITDINLYEDCVKFQSKDNIINGCNYKKKNIIIPKKKYNFSFFAKTDKDYKNIRFKIYTGIKWQIIEKNITTEYQKFELETNFDFTTKSRIRIGFETVITNMSVFIYYPNII